MIYALPWRGSRKRGPSWPRAGLVFQPQVAYQAAAGAGRNVTANAPSDNGGPAGTAIEFDGSVSWEIDLWGRIRRLNESARAQFLATQEARRNLTISLLANVAASYFQLLALDKQLSIAEDSTNSFTQSLTIFSQRLRGGVSSKLETASARAALASAAASIPELRRQIAAQENQLRLLLGLPPAPLLRGRAALEDERLPEVPPAFPPPCSSAVPIFARPNNSCARPTPASAWPRPISIQP